MKILIKMQIKKKFSNLIVLSSILILLSLSPILLYSTNTLIGSTKTPFNKESPKTSGFWNLPFIHVNNNWSDTASTYDWCTGSGSWSDPYIIENVTIDAGADGSCIIIQNSNDYFLINNCTLINSGTSGYDAGITLNQANNGRIEKTNCSTNYLGIYLHMSENNTIDSNIINSNLGSGIVLYHSKNNTFIGNNESGSWYYGLFINSVSDNNRIIGNTFNYNTGAATYGDGIRIVGSVNCTIYGNTLRHNEKGLIIDNNAHNNTVENNLIKDNIDYGILINNNTKSSIDNKIYNNQIENPAGINGYDNGTNTQWSLGTLGNYWHDYPFDDLDDDGIGDTPYNIPGWSNAKDYFPIWDDGDDINPTISINSPSGGSLFGTDAPTYSLNIFDLNLNQSWYTLNSTTTRYFFTPTNGINVVPIDETGWDSFSDGSMLMAFYVNDSGGNLASVSNAIVKDAINPTITLNSPLGDTTFGSDAPEFNLTIYDLNLIDAWYTIGSSVTQYSFSPINGINVIQINESCWDALPEGSITINFFVSDTVGNIHSIQVIINKDLPDPVIPFGNYYILFLGIGIVSILLVEHKKRKK